MPTLSIASRPTPEATVIALTGDFDSESVKQFEDAVAKADGHRITPILTSGPVGRFVGFTIAVVDRASGTDTGPSRRGGGCPKVDAVVTESP